MERPLAYVARQYFLYQVCDAVNTRRQRETTCQNNISSLSVVSDAVKSFESGAAVDSGWSLGKEA